MLLAAANIYKRLGLDLILVKLDITKVSLMPSLSFDSEIDMEEEGNDISSYPDVYAPIARDAISGATPLIFVGEALQWPANFDSFDSVLT